MQQSSHPQFCDTCSCSTSACVRGTGLKHVPDHSVWIMDENCTENSLELIYFGGKASGFAALRAGEGRCPETRVAEAATGRLLRGQVCWRILAACFEMLKELSGGSKYSCQPPRLTPSLQTPPRVFGRKAFGKKQNRVALVTTQRLRRVPLPDMPEHSS